MNILHIDDHELFCEGMTLLLRNIDDRVNVVHANTMQGGLAMLSELRPWQLILTDLQLPGLTGLDALKLLRSAETSVPVVVLAASEDAVQIQAAIELGAMGYIPKSSSSREVARALDLTMRGGVYLPLVAQAAPEAVSGAVHFTPRQRQVLQGIIQGKPNKVIARDLGISDTTVKTHVASVLEILGVHNRTQAVYAIAQMGLPLGELAPP